MPRREKAETAGEKMAPEYDFRSLGKPVRGKYYEKVEQGSNLVLLEPDVSETFPT